MKKYTVFIIQAYNEMTQQGGLSDVITLELIDKSVNSAITKAKDILKDSSENKKFFRLSHIIEKE